MEVADLGEQAERSESRDAAEAGERLDRLAPRLLAGDLVELRIDGEQLGVERAEVAERVFQSGLGEGVVEALSASPDAVPLCPVPSALAENAPVAEQLLADALTGGGARAAQVIAAANQIAQALLHGRRRADEAELTSAVEAHQFHSVAAIGLDAVARAHRCLLYTSPSPRDGLLSRMPSSA